MVQFLKRCFNQTKKIVLSFWITGIFSQPYECLIISSCIETDETNAQLGVNFKTYIKMWKFENVQKLHVHMQICRGIIGSKQNYFFAHKLKNN